MSNDNDDEMMSDCEKFYAKRTWQIKKNRAALNKHYIVPV